MKRHFAVMAISLLTFLSCSSEKTSSVSSDTAVADTSFTTEVQEPAVDSIATSSPGINNAPESSQSKQQSDCDFDSARKKALDKVANLNLSFVDDEFPADKNIDGCSINFHFYVKKITYDLDGNAHLQDKVFELKLDYRKIGVDFEFVDGKLFEVNSSKYQVIN